MSSGVNSTGQTYALDMQKVSKRFPGTLAVDKVDFRVKKGEVHALMGENGAGKSTLMKMLNGLFNDYTGDIYINGEKKLLHSPTMAKEAGIGMVYQELSLARRISIYENLLVGRLPKATFQMESLPDLIMFIYYLFLRKSGIWISFF